MLSKIRLGEGEWGSNLNTCLLYQSPQQLFIHKSVEIEMIIEVNNS